MAAAAHQSHTPMTSRVFLWTVPRSLSTAFLKSMSNQTGIQIINELYLSAYWFGPEKKNGFSEQEDDWQIVYNKTAQKKNVHFGDLVYDESICTYAWVKNMLEKDFPQKRLIFSKDHATYLDGRYDRIPNGYKHTFLIRHPYRACLSWKKVHEQVMQGEVAKFVVNDDMKRGYQSLFELMKYLYNNGIETNPIVIDADDLLANPKSILKQYCDAAGILFSDAMLQWEPGTDVFNKMLATRNTILTTAMDGFFDTVKQCTGFVPPSPLPARSDLPPVLLPLVDESMVYYEKMHAMRMKP